MRILRVVVAGLGLLGALHGCGRPAPPSAPTAPAASPTATPTPPQGPFVAGQVYFGLNAYVEYRAGDLPIILSAPHGGSLAPASIPDRTTGTTTTDSNTVELVIQLADAVARRFGGTPHIVICHLRRVKLDVNRELVEAAQGNPDAQQAWTEYHVFLDASRQAASARFGRGFYLDIHGHSHPQARVELGYLLDASDLARSDNDLNLGSFASRSSIRSLVASGSAPFATVLRGPGSLGGLLAARGFPAVPSPAVPSPGGDPYFSGGYSTERHGSASGGTVSAVQIESPFAGFRDTTATRAAYADALADAIRAFLAAYADSSP